MTDNYEKLANAIILQAVYDYRKARHTLSLYPSDCSAKSEKSSIESFFHSQLFSVLTGLDPKALLSRLNKEEA
ncbi:MAG: hypothetical protein RSA20_01705 [Oscillospiraceae bacterium]